MGSPALPQARECNKMERLDPETSKRDLGGGWASHVCHTCVLISAYKLLQQQPFLILKWCLCSSKRLSWTEGMTQGIQACSGSMRTWVWIPLLT